MTDLHARLRDADPLRTDAALSADELAAMRRTVVETARLAPRAPARLKRTLAIAAVFALIAGAAADLHRRSSNAVVVPETPAVSAPLSPARPTQLHFSTPGGTRIIWTLDPAFQLTEKR